MGGVMSTRERRFERLERLKQLEPLRSLEESADTETAGDYHLAKSGGEK
jgi:hypothetical protein